MMLLVLAYGCLSDNNISVTECRKGCLLDQLTIIAEYYNMYIEERIGILYIMDVKILH